MYVCFTPIGGGLCEHTKGSRHEIFKKTEMKVEKTGIDTRKPHWNIGIVHHMIIHEPLIFLLPPHVACFFML